MPPVLSDAEIAQLNKEKAKQQNFADALTAQIPAQQARAAELAVADGGFKKFFSYYNDDIISKYDAERKAMDGEYIASPIVENDIIQPAQGNAFRTTPTLPATDLVRIPEFDGGNTTNTDTNELYHMSQQALIEDALVNGAAGGPYPVTLETASALTSASATLDVEDASVAISLSSGNYVLVSDGLDSCFFVITNVTITSAVAPYAATLDIVQIVEPLGSIAIGATFDQFTGFNNTERTNQVASDSNFQPIMDFYIDRLVGEMNNRIARLDEQLAAISGNLDPDGVAQLNTAQTNVNTSKSFLNSYILSPDISDTGISSISFERSTRSGQISSRISEIEANYTGQTENYYDRRYQIANDRGNTSRGTLRLQYATEAAVATSQTYAASAQDAVDAIDALLGS